MNEHHYNLPIDGCIYYKIYCGPATANQLLKSLFLPLTVKLKKEKKITHWFFIRYFDPLMHIRVRLFFYPSTADEIIRVINKKLSPFFTSNLISDVTINSYKPEYKRYTTSLMPLAESIFDTSSTFVAALIKECDDISNETYENAAIISTKKMIEVLLPEEPTRFQCLLKYNRALTEEQNVTRISARWLSNKYKEKSIVMDSAKSKNKNHKTELLTHHYFCTFKEIITKNRQHIEKLADNSKYIFITSIIHMHINRLFGSQQRLAEMVVINLIFRSLKTAHYKNKSHIIKPCDSVKLEEA